MRSHVRAFLKAWQFLSRSLPSLQKPQAPPSERRQAPALALRASGKFGSVVRGLQASADTVATCLQIFGARAPLVSLFVFVSAVPGARASGRFVGQKKFSSSRAEQRGEVSPLRPPHCHRTAYKSYKKNKTPSRRFSALCLCYFVSAKNKRFCACFFRSREKTTKNKNKRQTDRKTMQALQALRVLAVPQKTNPLIGTVQGKQPRFVRLL